MDTPSSLIFLRLASSSIMRVGSAPGESRQMRGTLLVLCAHVASRFTGTDSTKRGPSASLM